VNKPRHTIVRALLALLLASALLSGCSIGVEEEFEGPVAGEQTEITEEKTGAPAAEKQAEAAEATVPPTAAPAQAQPTAQPETKEGKDTWTVMFYMDADDETLEKDIFTDLNEAERVGSTDSMHLVAQIDRYEGAFDGDGDWTGARRYLLEQDPDLKAIDSPVLEDLGEVNMAEASTLVDFVTWAIRMYPANKYALILSDHGMGWPGGWFDPAPGGLGDHDLALAEDFGDGLWLMEMDEALTAIRQQTKLDQFELIGFDACLMGQIEVLQMLSPHAKYAVVSQEVEPALGWAYADFLAGLAFDTGMDGATLAKSIVESYIVKDQLIVDDEARKEFASEVLETRRATAEQAAEQMSYDVTLTAVDLSAAPALVEQLDQLAVAMSKVDQDVVAEARAYALSFENAFDEDLPSPDIDLGSFLDILIDEDVSDAVTQAAEQTRAALTQAVVAEKHGEQRDGATGISIYFPVFDIYDYADNYGYTTVAAPFTEVSQWDEYLHFHFTNEPPEGDAWDDEALWDVGAKSGGRAGAEPIEITPIELSGEVASEDEPVTLSATVTGKQLAYIYVQMGRISDDETVLMLDDMDYIMPDKTRKVNGVVFPDWEGDEVEIGDDFEPVIYVINDGETTAPALLAPYEFGAESPTYMCEGTYHFAKGGRDRYAQLLFRDSELVRVLGFNDEDGTGAPREITPNKGDTFTIRTQGLYLTDDVEDEFYAADGETLTFGEEHWTWEEAPAPAGIYVVGFIAEDFDGEQYVSFEVLEVE